MAPRTINDERIEPEGGGVNAAVRRSIAEEADRAIEHPLVADVMAEYAENMGFELDGLAAYGLAKVASYAAQVARAQVLGIDPDALRATPYDFMEHVRRLRAQ